MFGNLNTHLGMEMTPIYNDDFWSDDEGQEGTGF